MKLELRHGHSLVMTQQLQQSIKLLQCTSLELREFVDLELEKNPFLIQEEGEGDPAPAEEANENVADEDDSSAEASEDRPREADFGDNDFSASNDTANGDFDTSGDSGGDDRGDIERDYLRESSHASTGSGGSFDDGEDTRGIEDNPSQDMSLRQHLLEQLQLDMQDPTERMIGAQLIDMTDEAGYIKDDLAPAAEQLGVELAEVEAVLQKLQRFDPSGVCARTLQECLTLQLRDQNRLDPAMQALLDNLNLVAEGRFDELRKRCGVDKEDLRQMVSEIRSLNPKPGSGFSHEISHAVEPDAFIRRLPDGNWHVELNMNNFPKVMVNKRYYKKITQATRNVQDKKYLSEQFGSASWLVRALEQRAETLLKVCGELVKQQDAFFRLGVRYLRPMTLKMIAAETNYHESTISRVTNGKFIVCPRGTFELKYFFTSALQRAEGGGDDVSSESVKHYIGEMIERETGEAILSDDEIVEKLKERNITVARRTVAKYREAIGIPSSPKRKRLKLQAL